MTPPSFRARATVVTAAALLLAGCGQEVRYQLPPAASTSAPTTTPVRTTTPRRTTVAGDATTRTTTARPQWVDVTGNLAALPSECGTMSSLWARPDRDTIVAGVAAQGLWVSEAGFPEWVPLGQGAGSEPVRNRAQHFLLDPADPNTFYQAGSAGQGVYVTNDNGATFRALGSPLPTSDQILVDFSDPQRATMLSSTHETLDLRRSTDGGRTFTNIAGDIPDVAGLSRGTVMLDRTTYLLGTFRGTDSGIFRTTDAGQTWTRVFSGSVGGLPLTRKDGSIWWILEGGAVAKSTDGGLTWTEGVRPNVLAPGATHLIELPDGRLASYSRTLVVSDVAGTKWKALGGSLPYPPAGLAYSPFRKSFYIWRFDCSEGTIPVGENAIMQLTADLPDP